MTVQLTPLSTQSPRRVRAPNVLSTSSLSSHGARLEVRPPRRSSSTSPSLIYVRDPVDGNTRRDVLGRHTEYKTAVERHDHDLKRYGNEQTATEASKKKSHQILTPRRLLYKHYQVLAPRARKWETSATR